MGTHSPTQPDLHIIFISSMSTYDLKQFMPVMMYRTMQHPHYLIETTCYSEHLCKQIFKIFCKFVEFLLDTRRLHLTKMMMADVLIVYKKAN